MRRWAVVALALLLLLSAAAIFLYMEYIHGPRTALEALEDAAGGRDAVSGFTLRDDSLPLGRRVLFGSERAGDIDLLMQLLGEVEVKKAAAPEEPRRGEVAEFTSAGGRVSLYFGRKYVCVSGEKGESWYETESAPDIFELTARLRRDDIAATLAGYRALLTDYAPYIAAESGELTDLDSFITGEWERIDRNAAFTRFTLVDLDRDAIPELILEEAAGSVSISLLILRRDRSGQVYGYLRAPRSMGGLKENGSFSWSNGAFHGGLSTLSFSGLSVLDDAFTYVETEPGKPSVFVVNGEKSDEETFGKAMEAWEKLPAAQWHEIDQRSIWNMFSSPSALPGGRE